MASTTATLGDVERAYLAFAYSKTDLSLCHAARRCPLALLCLPEQPQCARLGALAAEATDVNHLGLAEHLVAMYFVQETGWDDCLACPNYALCGSAGFEAPVCSELIKRYRGQPHHEERHAARTRAMLEQMLREPGAAPPGPTLVFGDVPPDGVDLALVRSRCDPVHVMGVDGVPDPVFELGRQLWTQLDPLLRPDSAGGRSGTLASELLRVLRAFQVDYTALPIPRPGYVRVVASMVNLRLFAGTLVRLAEQVLRALGPQRGETLLTSDAWSQSCHAVMGQLEVAVAQIASGALAPGGLLYFSQASRYCQYVPQGDNLLGTDALAFAHADAQQPEHWHGVTSRLEAQWALGVQPAPIGEGSVVYEVIGGIYQAPE